MADLNTYKQTTHVDENLKSWLMDKMIHVIRTVNRNSMLHKEVVLAVLTSGGDSRGSEVAHQATFYCHQRLEATTFASAFS